MNLGHVAGGSMSDLGTLADPAFHTEPIELRNQETRILLDDLRRMILIRKAEEAIAELYVQKKVRCPCHLAIGQEAVAVGVARHLRPTDRSYGAHRSHSHYLALDGDLNALFAEVMGKETGCSKGMGGSMHLYSADKGFGGSVPIVAGTVPVAVGAALSFKTQKLDRVAVAFFGDGACEEGVVHECLNMAAVMKLPVIFVVENNLFSSHLDIALRQPSNRVSRFAEAHRIPALTIDGNDLGAVAEAAEGLISAARAGHGPGFLEGITYRWRGHVGPNEDIDVGLLRRPEDIKAWKRRDPVERLTKALVATRGIVPEQLQEIETAVDAQVDAAVRFAEDSPYPQPSALLDRVYAPKRISSR